MWKAVLSVQHAVRLRHQFTASQMTHCDRMLTSAERLPNDEGASPDHVRETTACLDQGCLAFCIYLLDHYLKACLFESTIVGFLAVLGIDERKGVTHLRP
jgi:hypothetical protein